MGLKQFVFRAARLSGATRAVAASPWRRARLLILCYHGVSFRDEHECDPELYVPPELLRARLAQLRAGGYAVVSLREGMRRLEAGTLPPRSVALTFDDGARDFAERAVPILEEFGAPATVYLTTYYCLNSMPVFDTALRYLLWRGRASGADVASAAALPGRWPVDTPAARSAAWRAIYDGARQRALDAPAKDELLRAVAGRVGVDYDEFLASGMLQLMTPDQVRALPRGLVDVELHTHRHRTPRDRAQFLREIDDNRAALAGLDVRDATHFCYPSGDYWGDFVGWLRERGVRSATTCVPGIASRESNPMLLPRFVDTCGVAEDTFEAWASGFAAMLPRRAAYRFDARRLHHGAGA